MRLFWISALAACATLGLVNGAWAASAKDQVVAAYAAWDQAFNTGDASKLAPFYTDDAVRMT